MGRQIDLDVIREIILVSKRMEEQGLVNAFEGNLSVKRDGLLYITPAQTRKSMLDEDMIAVFDGEDRQIHGRKKASSEKIMHTLAYTVRAEIGAVVHCHSPYLTAHAMCHLPIDHKCHPEILTFFKDIPVAPYGPPGSREIIDNAKPYLKNRNVVLLANHGVLAVGSTLELAYSRVEAAEKFAMILSHAKQMGTLKDLPQDEVKRLKALPIET